MKHCCPSAKYGHLRAPTDVLRAQALHRRLFLPVFSYRVPRIPQAVIVPFNGNKCSTALLFRDNRPRTQASAIAAMLLCRVSARPIAAGVGVPAPPGRLPGSVPLAEDAHGVPEAGKSPRVVVPFVVLADAKSPPAEQERLDRQEPSVRESTIGEPIAVDCEEGGAL